MDGTDLPAFSLSLSLSLSNAHNCVKLSHENSPENKVLPVSIQPSQNNQRGIPATVHMRQEEI